jgi:C-terminal processing protease CtpA/Prc
MKMKKLFFLPIISLALFTACKKDNVTPAITLTPAMARDSLYSVMEDMYFWYDLMPNVTKENYDDPYELMEAMKYKPLDRWSFVADYDKFMAQIQGEFVGHGFRIGLDDSDDARIMMIFSRSALYLQGVRRGWIVKKINGTDVAPILQSKDSTAYSKLIGPSKAGITNIFLFQKPDGTEVTIASTKSTFIENSVLLYDTLHLSSGITTGHLVFDSFITPSENELAAAFAFFKANGVQDLILDLRYNSGGLLYVAQILASYIAGNAYQGTEFVKLLYNDMHPEKNFSFPFESSSNPLSLQRLVVITTHETASASECVMNGLKPNINVVSIGDTTDGKPTGMDGGDIGKKYFIAPVTFKIVNKNNEGDYFDGIAPAAVVTDDLTHDFYEREELCLKEAINYLETGSVSTKGVSTFKRHPQFSEKPAWMNNAFVLGK